jgi:hypothetical protein
VLGPGLDASLGHSLEVCCLWHDADSDTTLLAHLASRDGNSLGVTGVGFQIHQYEHILETFAILPHDTIGAMSGDNCDRIDRDSNAD